MSRKSLNKATIIGNLVKDPQFEKTKAGVPVCTFHVITDRQWMVEGERRTDTTKHICVAWDKLGEICANILNKGDLVYVEGRIEKHDYTDEEGVEREQTEIIADEMIKLE